MFMSEVSSRCLAAARRMVTMRPKMVFPVVVLIGAGSTTTDERSKRFCEWLGQLSYPLYIVHYPLMYMQMAWVATHPDAPVWHHVLLNTSVVAVSVAMSWAMLRLYDEPVRAWLKKKLFA